MWKNQSKRSFRRFFSWKTSLIQRYISGRNDIQNSRVAVFVQLHHSFENKDKKLTNFLFNGDTAGQERYHALIPMYVRDTDYIIITFDLSNPLTFMNLKTRIDLLR